MLLDWELIVAFMSQSLLNVTTKINKEKDNTKLIEFFLKVIRVFSKGKEPERPLNYCQDHVLAIELFFVNN